MKFRIVRGLAVGAVLLGVGLATTTTAGAVSSGARTANEELLFAMRRDLGLTEQQAKDRIVAQDAALRLNNALTPRLGKEFAGSWLDERSGELVVAVTSTERAAQARAAGATTKVVPRSLSELEAVKAELDKQLPGDPAAVAWRTDPERNAVVVTVLKGQSSAVAARYGDAVQVEETDVAPRFAATVLRGGDGYDSGGRTCSAGFNVFSGSTIYFLTAGHCGPIGTDTFRNGVWIGAIARSDFPTLDYGAVRYDNPGAWTPGPWINAYVPGNPNLVYNVNGTGFSPKGTAVCKSGVTTGLTCGVIKEKGEAVQYDHDANPATPTVTVFGLVRHNACVEPGDSGGANFTWNAANKNFAEGMTSGAQTKKDGSGKPRCLSFFGQENVSWFSLVTEATVLYGLNLWTTA
jgi:streptogrisin C